MDGRNGRLGEQAQLVLEVELRRAVDRDVDALRVVRGSLQRGNLRTFSSSEECIVNVAVVLARALHSRTLRVYRTSLVSHVRVGDARVHQLRDDVVDGGLWGKSQCSNARKE